jgi:hypothetical protein
MAQKNDGPDTEFEWRRLDSEWISLNALREAVGIGQRSTGGRYATYSEALDIARRVAPTLFDPALSLLTREDESPVLRGYKERAEAESVLQHRRITSLDLLNRDIERLEKLTQSSEHSPPGLPTDSAVSSTG